MIEALGAGPVDLFASSGGAVNALALVAGHPDDVRRLVAHEPPTAVWVPDRDVVVAACRDIVDTYQRAGYGPAMAKFISLVMYDGVLPEDYLDRQAPDPAMFGMSTDDDGDRSNPLMRNMPACQLYEPDVAALRAMGDRLVIAVGKASGEGMAARGGRSVAAEVGVAVTDFAGGHDGFLGGEFGQTGEPDAFAPTCAPCSAEARRFRLTRRAPRDRGVRGARGSAVRGVRPSRCMSGCRTHRGGMPDSPWRNARLTVGNCRTHPGEMPDSPWGNAGLTGGSCRPGAQRAATSTSASSTSATRAVITEPRPRGPSPCARAAGARNGGAAAARPQASPGSAGPRPPAPGS